VSRTSSIWVAILSLCCTAVALGEPSDPQARVIDFTVREGTWMSVDVSRDSAWLIFDLLGEIYRVAASGGNAESLTQDSGGAINIQPRFSPDGHTIAFISDRGGQQSLWLMAADGGQPRPLWADRGTRFTQPTWTPDGRSLIVVRHQPTMDGMHRRVASLWRVPIDGSAPTLLAQSPDANYYDPAPSPDGRVIYFTAAFLLPNRFGTESQHTIEQLDLATGAISDVVRRHPPQAMLEDRFLGGATQGYAVLAPTVSPDGSTLAYARQNPDAVMHYRGHAFGPRTELWLRDLKTGAEHRLLPEITEDLAGAHAMFSLSRLPMFAWSHDGARIFLTLKGKLFAVNVSSGERQPIAFTAHVHRELPPPTRAHMTVADHRFDSRFLQWPASSPDGSKVAFVAGGDLWIVDLRSGVPRRVIDAIDGAFFLSPSWSPDGRWILYCTWGDQNRGSVWRVSADGGEPQRLIHEPGEYIYPQWNTGNAVTVMRGTLDDHTPYAWAKQKRWQLVKLAAGSTPLTVLFETPPTPTIPVPSVEPGGRVDLQVYDETADQAKFRQIQRTTNLIETSEVLTAVPLDGTAPWPRLRMRRIIGGIVANGYPGLSNAKLSPDGRFVALEWAGSVYVANMPTSASGTPELRIDPLRPEKGGLTRLGSHGGYYASWRAGGGLEFFAGSEYYRYDPVRRHIEEHTLAVSLKTDAPSGSIAFTHAKLITLDAAGVIEGGTLVVRDNRISCLGRCDTTHVDRLIDARGRSIIPGFVDVHAHFEGHPAADFELLWNGVVPQHHDGSAEYLAYGVTTALDPATSTRNSIPLSELTEEGRVVGPRTFSAAEAVYGYGEHVEIESPEDARYEVERRALIGVHTIKHYRTLTRDQSQELVTAVRAAGLTITSCNDGLISDLQTTLDGFTGFEHYIPTLPIYADVAEFLGRAGTVYSPTVNVAGNPYGAFHYWRAKHNLLADPKFMRFIPTAAAKELMSYIRDRPDSVYSFPIVAEGLADIIHHGGYGALGSHGEDFGIGTQHEIWSYATALTPLEVLTVASKDGAYFLGLDQELGTLKVGKLADLIVLDADPLEDIHNTARMAYVMKNGVLYNSETLDELWPVKKSYGPVHWDDPAATAAKARPTEPLEDAL
jgi:Tol biopolymer transport system component